MPEKTIWKNAVNNPATASRQNWRTQKIILCGGGL